VVKRRLSFVIVLSCVLVATATGALAFSEKKSLYDHPGFPFESVEEGARHGVPTNFEKLRATDVPAIYSRTVTVLASIPGTMQTATTVRGGPGTAYASLGQISSGTQVTVIEYDGSYYFIELQN
jgi:uncharacterized protein YgiM (DUF1202 family)